jgi:hypothetical protein
MPWGRATREDGLVTIGTQATTVPKLARVFDPSAPWILVSEVGPVLGGGWTQARVPEGCRHRILAVSSQDFRVRERARVLKSVLDGRVNRPCGLIPAVRGLV